MDFNDVDAVTALIRSTWDAGVLFALRDRRPLRYSEIGAKLTTWSGRHPGDSALTRSLKRLEHLRLVVTEQASGERPKYMITAAGERDLVLISAVVGALRRARPTAARTRLPQVDGNRHERPSASGGAPMRPSQAAPKSKPADPTTGVNPNTDSRPQVPTSTLGASPVTPDPPAGQEQRGGDMTVPAGIDTTKPHAARRYDYWLGGKDNFAADRASGDAIERMFPTIRLAVLENRGFLRRATDYLVREAGIRQILDIGTGIPTSPNTHEIAQAAAPDAKVVYVDNDPIVLSHARALLTSTPHGATSYIEADLRQPERILADPGLRETIDTGQPVALMMIAVLHFIEDAVTPVEYLRRALPSGSYVAITHIARDLLPPSMEDDADKTGKRGGVPTFARTKEQIAKLLDGLALVGPGIVPVSEWRDPRAPGERPAAAEVAIWGVVAEVP